MDPNTTLETRVAALEKALVEVLSQAVTGIKAVGRRQGVGDICASLAQVSKMYPKTRHVIFVGRGYFGDNIKYAYLAFNDYARGRDVTCSFFTEDDSQHKMLSDAGLPCLPPDAAIWSPAETRSVLGARAVVLADYFFARHWRNPVPYALLQGAKTVQLWHGIPIKGVGLEHIPPTLVAGDPAAAEILASCGPFDVFVGSSAAARGPWARRFAFRDYAGIGAVRDDVLLREPAGHDLLNVDRDTLDSFLAARMAGKPVVFYAPTFREGGALQWFHDGGIAALAEHCARQGYLLCVNLHPADHGHLADLRARHAYIRFVAPQSDIFPVLQQADVLVTDYSSLMFDFLLLDRPIVLYRPDHESYAAATRGLIEDNARLAPGELVADSAALLPAIDAAVAMRRQPQIDSYRATRLTIRQAFFDQADGRAGERLGALIMREIDRL